MSNGYLDLIIVGTTLLWLFLVLCTHHRDMFSIKPYIQIFIHAVYTPVCNHSSIHCEHTLCQHMQNTCTKHTCHTLTLFCGEVAPMLNFLQMTWFTTFSPEAFVNVILRAIIWLLWETTDHYCASFEPPLCQTLNDSLAVVCEYFWLFVRNTLRAYGEVTYSNQTCGLLLFFMERGTGSWHSFTQFFNFTLKAKCLFYKLW